MRRYLDFLTPFGLAVMVAAVFFAQRGKLPGELMYWVIGGGLFILAHLILRGPDIVRGVGARQMQYGASTLVLALSVAAGLGVVNYLVFRHDKSWDFSKSQRFSLAEQTKKVVAGLKDDITVTYFQPRGEGGTQDAEDRLRAYQGLSSKIKFQFLDPLADPERTEKYQARGPYPMVFVERAGRPQEKLSSASEQDLTNAIVKVTREGTRKVCFVTGDGERALSDSGPFGVSGTKTLLEKSAYETQEVALLSNPEIPADCVVLVVAGPQKDLLPPIVDSIRGYVKKGGKLLIMVESSAKEQFPNVTALLKGWNLEVGNDQVLEWSPIGQLFGLDAGPIAPVVVQYPYHEITKDLQGLGTVFATVRSVKAGTGAVEGVVTQNLAETSPRSWAETTLDFSKEPVFDEGKDIRGPVPLAAVATVTVTGAAPTPAAEKKEGEEEEKKPEGRVVAVGDVDFASNQLLGRVWNKDFFLNSVAWLSRDMDLISIRPKDPDSHRVSMTPMQKNIVMGLSLFVLPFSFVGAGVMTWLSRRG